MIVEALKSIFETFKYKMLTNILYLIEKTLFSAKQYFKVIYYLG